jgi:hypothetical protein
VGIGSTNKSRKILNFVQCDQVQVKEDIVAEEISVTKRSQILCISAIVKMPEGHFRN